MPIKNPVYVTFTCPQCCKVTRLLESVYRDDKPTFCSWECYLNSRKREIKQCLQCGYEFQPMRNSQIFCSDECSRINRKGKPLSKTTPGYWFENGYKIKYMGDGEGRKVHILLKETEIGRRLLKCEVVHHIDGNPLNNEPSNLQLMSRSAHTSLHRKIKYKLFKSIYPKISLEII